MDGGGADDLGVSPRAKTCSNFLLINLTIPYLFTSKKPRLGVFAKALSTSLNAIITLIGYDIKPKTF